MGKWGSGLWQNDNASEILEEVTSLLANTYVGIKESSSGLDSLVAFAKLFIRFCPIPDTLSLDAVNLSRNSNVPQFLLDWESCSSVSNFVEESTDRELHQILYDLDPWPTVPIEMKMGKRLDLVIEKQIATEATLAFSAPIFELLTQLFERDDEDEDPIVTGNYGAILGIFAVLPEVNQHDKLESIINRFWNETCEYWDFEKWKLSAWEVKYWQNFRTCCRYLNLKLERERVFDLI